VSDARDTSWRQGDIVSASNLRELIQRSDLGETTVGIVVSHDCDLAAGEDKEPRIELIPACPITRLGQDSHAKTSRRLHIQYQTDAGAICFELRAVEKCWVPKAKLLALTPASDVRLVSEGRRILQRWLAARYDRAAFPENFEIRLRQTSKTSKKTLIELIAVALDAAGEHVRAILFDLDNGEERERVEFADPYQLGVVVLYVGNPEDDVALEKASEVATAIEKILAGAEGIALNYCNAVSDSAMSIQQATKLKEWRLEYLSFRAQPAGPTMSI
jgi:hypothetical protein